jgi:small subunit ribosomal protein S18
MSRGTARPTQAAPRPARRKKALLGPDITSVDYKDVDLLRSFISDRGKIRSRRVTHVSPQQQRLVTRAVKNAREMALLPYPGH